MKITVGHVEIPVDDVERASHFYERAFGWRAVPSLRPKTSYLLLDTSAPTEPARAGGSTVGGLITRGQWEVEQPLIMLHVENGTVAQCLRGVVAAGGAIALSPTSVEGRSYAQFRDTEGNLFGLWGRSG